MLVHSRDHRRARDLLMSRSGYELRDDWGWECHLVDRTGMVLVDLHRHIGPRFERAFIADSCACIKERGTLYAVRRLEAKVRSITQNWTRRAYYLKCDLANFFPSIDKQILEGLLVTRIPDPWWRDLALRVLHHDPRTDVEVRGDPKLLARIPPAKSLFHAPAGRGS